MKKTTCILSLIVLALSLWAVALWLLPFGGYDENVKETRYGVNEGMEVVEQTVADGQRQYIVEDARGNMLFRIPLRGCMIDTRFRSGRMRTTPESRKSRRPVSCAPNLRCRCPRTGSWSD